MNVRLALCVLLLAAGGCAQVTALSGPVADHHQHLISPAAAKRGNEPALPAIALPEDLARLLRLREERWNDKTTLAELLTEEAVVLDRAPGWIRGREDAAAYLGTLFARPYRITPVSYRVDGSMAHVAAYFTRGEGEAQKHFGHVLFSLEKGSDGAWRIAAESPTFPGPRVIETSNAEQRIPQLDAAGIRRAAILSVAYWFGSPLDEPVADEYGMVKAENDWTIAEVARFPDRLVAMCSFNPLKDYALPEIARCAKLPHVKGLKLHFGNSGVDVRNPEHVARVREVFRSANEHRLAIVAHLWTLDPRYGSEDAEIFLKDILPAAPDVTVQIAHFAGGGPGYTDPALEVFAKAIAARDPRTKNLYFDIATVADGQTEAVLNTFAARIRQVGPKRVLFGTDLAPPAARQSWLNFRTTVPLTDAEFNVIAKNIAPYLR